MGLSVVTPTEVVATHLLEIVKANFGRLFTRRSLAQAPRRVHLAHRHPPRRGEPPDARRVHPRQGADRHAAGGAAPPPRGARLDPQPAARSSRRSPRRTPRSASAEVLCEQVRHRLGFQLVAGIQEADGALPLIQLNPSWEEIFQTYQLPEGARHRRRRAAAGRVQPPRQLGRRAHRPRRRPGALPGGRHLDQAPALPAHGPAGQGHPQPGLLLRGDRRRRPPGRPRPRLMYEGLGALLDLTQAGLVGFILVFTRVAGVVALLPGFGEQMIPARVRLGVAIAFAMVVWPMLAPGLLATDPARPLLLMLIIEASIGLMLGLAIRLMVLALQLAGSIAAQSTALAQIFGAGVAPDPMPAIGNILMLAGITLAVASGLHVKAAVAMARSYEILPMGLPVPAVRRRRLGHGAGGAGLRPRLLARRALRDRRLRLQPRARRHQPRHAAAHGRLHRRPGDHRRRPPHPDAGRAGDPPLLGRAARRRPSPTRWRCRDERGACGRREGLRPDAAEARRGAAQGRHPALLRRHRGRHLPRAPRRHRHRRRLRRRAGRLGADGLHRPARPPRRPHPRTGRPAPRRR